MPANVLTILIGIPCAVLAFKKRQRLIGLLGVFFALTPTPIGLILLAVQAHLNGVSSD
jgi:hypothetical protein